MGYHVHRFLEGLELRTEAVKDNESSSYRTTTFGRCSSRNRKTAREARLSK